MSGILIVDDDRTTLRLYARMLKSIGETTCFGDSERALAWAKRNDPHLIVVDYQMPTPNGIDFIRRFRADLTKTDTPIIMLTGELEKTVRHEALRCGASAFLTKPVDAIELQTYADNLVTARRTRLASARQAERIRKLYNVASTAGKTSRERLAEAVRVGVSLIGADTGVIASVEGDDAVIRHIGDNVGLGDVHRLPLERTFLRHVLRARSVVAIDDLDAPPWANDPARISSPAYRSYIACPFDVFGKPYGALVFMGLQPRSSGFDYSDRDFVRLMSALVSSTVEHGVQADRLDALAFYDALTGLPNRNLLADRLERMLVTAKRQSTSFGVQYLDLDGFKGINDGAGHAAGDEVLRLVARRLEDAVRESDTVARLGGDEFVVLQAHLTDRAGATTLAKRIVRSMGEPFETRFGTFTIGASVGISIYPADGASSEQLLANADAALYAAKGAGRATAVFFDPLLHRAKAGADSPLSDLRRTAAAEFVHTGT